MHLLSIHYSQTRHADFAAAKEIFYDEELKCWISFHPETVVDLLRDERLLVPDTIGPIERLEARYKRQFPNLIFAARAIPLLLNGQAHSEMRRRIAEYLTEGRARTAAALPDIMKRHVTPLKGRRQIEWVSDCIEPMVADIGTLLCNSPDPVPYPKLALTRLFDRFAGLTALREAESQFAQVKECLERSSPDIDPAITIALLTLGRDSLVGTLATSLHSVLSRNVDRRFADIEFPDYPPETGVAVAERTATQAITRGGETIPAGDKLRLYFQPVNAPGSTVNKMLLFGTGAHSCLGRPVSVDAWNLMAQALRGFSDTVTSVEAEFEPSTMFIFPRYLRTELGP